MTKKRFHRLLRRHNTLAQAAASLDREIEAGQAQNGPWAVIFTKILELAPQAIKDGEPMTPGLRKQWIDEVVRWLTGRLDVDGVDLRDIADAETTWAKIVVILKIIVRLGARFIAGMLVSCAYGTTPRGRLRRMRRTIARIRVRLENNAEELGYELVDSETGELIAYEIEREAEGAEGLVEDPGEDEDDDLIVWQPLALADLA